ncbi:MAG: hypothetical protein WAL34_07405 [Acidobacteriaceae bacterium]
MSSRNPAGDLPDRVGEAVEVGELGDIGAGVQRIAPLDIGRSRRDGQDQHEDGQQGLAGLQVGQALQAGAARQLEVERDQARPGRGASAKPPARRRNCMARSPSPTTCRRTARPTARTPL